MRWLRRIALVVVVAWALFVFGWAPYWLAGIAITRRFQFPDKENGGLTPASFELAFQEVRFAARDGVELEGWWVPADAPRGTVVLVHGLNRSRIEMVKRLPFLHERGWAALLFDLRRHGASDGNLTTFGVNEKDDVAAAVAWVRERQSGPVVLWGISLGGATAMLAAAEDPTLAAVVCDSSYRSLRDTVTHHLQLFRGWRWWLRLVPRWPVADLAIFWMGRRGHFDPDAADVEAAARRLGDRPALFVANSGDRRMPPEIAFALRDAAGGSAQVLVVPGESHGGAWRDGREAYAAAVAELLERVAVEAQAAPAAAPGVPAGVAGQP